MFPKEFLDVFLPCLAALWAICSMVGSMVSFTKDANGEGFNLITRIGFVILGPFGIGILLSATLRETMKQEAYRDSQNHP